jgi:hypothetical protein
MFMTNQKSIFSGYKNAFDKIDPDDNDIFILCHDDIEINETPEDIVKGISIVNAEGFGFAGVAGTKLLGVDAVWWEQERWKQGHHSGQVHHLEKKTRGATDTFYPTYYGPTSKVVALDGLFLAVSAKTLRHIGLEKPSYLIGDWDFYDIYYTFSAYKEGFTNITIPLKVAHHSSGELVGREGWTQNRIAFIQNNKLPAGL